MITIYIWDVEGINVMKKKLKGSFMFNGSLVVLMAAIVLSGCGSTSEVELQEGKVNVVTTFYPLYDFASQIGGEHVNVINLVPAGVDSHEWSPKSQDMKNMTQAQLFIYNGAGFEGWVDDFFSSLKDENALHLVEASHGIALIENGADADHEEEHADEHEAEEAHADEHADEHEAEEAHADEHEEEAHAEGDGHDHGNVDPHVWLSPLQAKVLATNVRDGLIEVDPAHQADYEQNFKTLMQQLDQLHQKYVEMTSASERREFVVSHQAFGYLARDYDLTQVPVMGLSPDSEPTAQDMKEISQFVREHQIQYILFEELVSPKIAETLAQDLNIETLVFNPVEGLTKEQIKAGETYVSMMERNLTSLEKALQ
jgi:zinc transport system substrate-binding protein